ncbi:EVE domain protein [Marine Group I thaumarchaeote SCGC AAA799-P11]|uniref:EVE domain protein n=1 Tax=Marine Group I thaumarchaeote SCGC AAA799-P11 TaxID=1502295 RepID=A0A087RXZ9_9ARCH|nr:EVE domain protein [Marine Group I thaumarchaeote SCGC AAA799-P11]
MSNWIWPCTPENWPSVKEHKVWAVGTEGKGKRVLKGDKIIFYVNGTLHFHGIFEVTSDWHAPTFQWTDEDFVGQNSASEINLVEVQLGFASVNKLLPSLKFIEKKNEGIKGLYLRGTPHGPANSGKPISEEDYDLIFNELKEVQEEPNFKKIKEVENEFEELVELPKKIYETAKIPPPDKKTLEEIFQDVEKGRCAVPDFQRYWTWNKKQIEELWESIFQGYYIGSLLTWPSSEQKLGKIPIVGGSEVNENPDLILDGQQRITAIYYAVKAPQVPLPNTERPYEFFLNINALLDTSRDSSEIIDSESSRKIETKNLHNTKVQYKKKIFPLTLFQNRNYSDWLFGFYEHLKTNEGYDDEESKQYYKKLQEIFGNVWSSYEIPVVKLPESLLLDNVATVFERINSKGTPLGVFDLLNARFIIHDIVLKNEWEEIKDSHENIRKWYDEFKNDKVPLYIVQALALSKSGFLRRKTVLNLDELYKISGDFSSEEFLNDWNEMSKYVEETITRITSTGVEGFGAVNYDFIPYTIMVPLIASLLKEIENNPKRTSCINKIRFWYWNNILGDRYSGSTDSTVESDFKIMKKWFDGHATDPFDVEERSNFNTQKSNSALYKAVMCVIAKKGALDFIRGDPPQYSNLEDHHIFPRSKAKKFNAGDDIDSVLNRTLIFDKTNQFFSNKDPSEYLTEIMNEQNIDKSELQHRLSTHLISSSAFECLMNNDFVGFIKEREKTIREEFQKLVYPETDSSSIDLQELLKREDQNVEFKETLRWDVRQDKINPALEEVVAKEIACFMNSGGGKLLIGVDDDGNVKGLDRDYNTFKKKDSDDFQKHLTNILIKYLGKSVGASIIWSFHQFNGNEICLGEIPPSSQPVFVQINNEKKFFARMNSTCQPFDISDALDYISKHWS